MSWTAKCEPLRGQQTAKDSEGQVGTTHGSKEGNICTTAIRALAGVAQNQIGYKWDVQVPKASLAGAVRSSQLLKL